MAYIPYHSGVPDETELPAELSQARDVAALQEFLAPEPRRQKESARAANMARAAHDFFAEAVTVTPAVGPTFWIHFWTDVWRPNHKVTIRAAQTGWFRDLFGLHRFGGWHFELPRAAFPNGITMKFLLNGVHLMTGTTKRSIRITTIISQTTKSISQRQRVVSAFPTKTSFPDRTSTSKSSCSETPTKTLFTT